jgi:HEPN domain-containing protein
LTTIECEECGDIFKTKDFSINNAADCCKCGNIQIIVIEIKNAVNLGLKSMLTVRCKKSYPKIIEISELDRILAEKAEEKQKAKKSGFGFT